MVRTRPRNRKLDATNLPRFRAFELVSVAPALSVTLSRHTLGSFLQAYRPVQRKPALSSRSDGNAISCAPLLHFTRESAASFAPELRARPPATIQGLFLELARAMLSAVASIKGGSMNINSLRKCAVAVLCVSMINLGFTGAASAGVVDTGALMSTAREADLGSIRARLDREDVQQQLKELGVDAASIETRMASLSDQELHQLALEMQSAPAGGDVLAVVGLVFVVLIILEFTGVIDIFKRAP
jgi:hypothetical protein